MTTKQKIKKLTTPESYNEILQMAIQFQIHKTHSFPKCKSGCYLKLHGVDPKNSSVLFNWVDKKHGTNRTESYNPTNKTATVTIYDYE